MLVCIFTEPHRYRGVFYFCFYLLDMKYLISERQYKTILEIERQSGHYEWSPLDSFYDFMDDELPTKMKTKLFKKYFDKIFKTEIEKDEFYQMDVLGFFNEPRRSEWEKKFSSKDSLAGFAYFVAKNYFGLEEGVGIDYYVREGFYGDDSKTFYFFDPKLKIFVGYISIFPIENFPKKTYKVRLSAVDEELIGTGYGIRMYQNILTKVDYLMSDNNLYSGSYRIWKHVLPKYANVWGIYEENGLPKIKKLIPGKKTRTEMFDNFIASIKFNDL